MNESRLYLLHLRRIITASTFAAGNYKKIYYRRLSALNVLLQKQKLFEINKLNSSGAKFLNKEFKLPSTLHQLNKTCFRRLTALNGLLQKQKITEADQVSSSTKFGKPGVDPSAQGQQSRDDGINKRPPSLRSRLTSVTVTENIWTVPNALCVMRIGMAPVVGYLILNNQFGPAIAVFAVAGVTDLLDGWIARVVPGQSSVMGSFLDPMADKILVATLFLSLTYMDLIPVPLTALIIGRDAVLIMAGFYIRYQSLDPPRTLSRYFNVAYPTAQLAPTLISKVNTGIQLGLVGATLVSTVLPYDVHPYLQFLWYCTATSTVVSAVGYLFAKDTVKMLRKKRG